MGQNGTGDKKNSDDEDIMLFIDDEEEEEDLKFGTEIFRTI